MTVEVSLRHDFESFSLDCEFRIARPGITALFGPSGAGKTSIVNAIAGLLKPRQGRVAVDGRVLLDTDKRICVPAPERRIGTVFQDARLFPHMSVEANLRFGWRRADMRAGEDEIAHVIALLGLEHLRARGPSRLSGGEKSRVAFGRALLSSPTLLLLDEPLAALDGARKAEIFPYLERLRDEARVPMLYVSHSLDEVTRLADQMILLNDGRVTAHGSVFDLTAETSFGAVMDAKISPRSAGVGLTVLALDGCELIVPKLNRPVDARVRVRIRAEDVMLALEEPRAISANNVLPARVLAVRAMGDTHADIELRCGGAKLLARITRASTARLGLAPGIHLFAIVKSVTVDPQATARETPTASIARS